MNSPTWAKFAPSYHFSLDEMLTVQDKALWLLKAAQHKQPVDGALLITTALAVKCMLCISMHACPLQRALEAQDI